VPESNRKRLQPFEGASRWISGGLGLGAALATILASAHSCGLIDDQSTRLSVAGLTVSWIGLSPASDTAASLGDTLRYVATVTDRRGTALVGAAIEWKSEDSSIAAVDSAGFVIAHAPGATILTATVAGKVARARVVVRPRAARFDFGPDSILRVPEGGRTGVTVRALDARGHPLARSPAALHVADSSLAVVAGADLTGRVAGRTALVAELGGARDSIAVEVVPVPGRIVVVKGAEQHAAVESRLAEPVVVRVDSRAGHPMSGVVVRFAPGEGAGTARPDSVLTGSDGLAATAWITGDRPGLVRLVATVSGVDSTAVALADVEPSRANTRVVQLGDPPSGLAAGAEPMVVGVQLTDSSGRVLAGVPVAWKLLDGGAIVPHEARSDSAGEAHAGWRLGPRAGIQRARVLVGSARNVPAITVVAAGFPGAPAKLVAVSPATVDGIAGSALSKPLLVRVTDSVGNPVPGVAIAAVGSGSVADSLVASDSTGKAAIRWTLGEKAGAQSLTLAVDGVAPVRFSARARAGAPANLAFVGSASPAPKGQSRPARVRVTDGYGNPVSGASVAFAASLGSVRPARVMTDKDGLAATTWVLSRKAEHQSLTAALAKGGAKDVLEVSQRKASARATSRVSSGTSSTRTGTRRVSSLPPAKIVPLVGAASR
jgi:adhesin/invasin